MELRRLTAVGPACLLGFIALLLLAGSADASALTTMVPHGERSCFYALVDKLGEKGVFDDTQDAADQRSRLLHGWSVAERCRLL